jgi:hypothetical protein
MARKLTMVVPSGHVNPLCLRFFGARANFEVFAEREMILRNIASVEPPNMYNGSQPCETNQLRKVGIVE